MMYVYMSSQNCLVGRQFVSDVFVSLCFIFILWRSPLSQSIIFFNTISSPRVVVYNCQGFKHTSCNLFPEIPTWCGCSRRRGGDLGDGGLPVADRAQGGCHDRREQAGVRVCVEQRTVGVELGLGVAGFLHLCQHIGQVRRVRKRTWSRERERERCMCVRVCVCACACTGMCVSVRTEFELIVGKKDPNSSAPYCLSRSPLLAWHSRGLL